MDSVTQASSLYHIMFEIKISNNMGESRKQKSDKLEQGKGTIYHELGHLLGYILANANIATALGGVDKFVIGLLEKPHVSPKVHLYHIMDFNDKEELIRVGNNTQNIPRTLAWVCEVLLGCIIQCVFEYVNFKICYGLDKLLNGKNKMGSQDYSNVLNMNSVSDYSLKPIFESFREELENFVRSKDIVNKLAPYVQQIQNEISETDDFQKTYEGDDLELLYNSVSEILDDGMKVSYLEMINKFSDKLRSLHSS